MDQHPLQRTRFSLAGRLAAIAAAALMSLQPAMAQTVEDDTVPDAGLNVPEGLTVFGQENPNVRRATAMVNGEVITGTDIDQRLNLIIAANGGAEKVAEEERQRLRLQVLRNLIDETLQIQEARANEIEISPGEIDQTYERVARQNFGTDSGALDQYLLRNGSSPQSLKRQILGELAWNRLQGRLIMPFVNVSREEVDDVMARLEASKGTEEYRLAEIYLSANPDNAQETFQNMRRIMEQIQQGGSFRAYAQQFSEASTAAVGGDLGWVRLEVLPQQLAQVATGLSVGQIAGPVQIPGGFSILLLLDKRQILTADPRDAVLSLKQLSITFPAGISEAEATNLAGQFSSATQTIRGCGEADRIAAEIGAQVVDNDQVKVRDLPSTLQDSLLSLSVGEVTQPFGSVDDGVRVLVLCGRDDPKAGSGPTAETIMATMEEEKVNKKANTLLRDLRRDAIIEYN